MPRIFRKQKQAQTNNRRDASHQNPECKNNTAFKPSSQKPKRGILWARKSLAGKWHGSVSIPFSDNKSLGEIRLRIVERQMCTSDGGFSKK